MTTGEALFWYATWPILIYIAYKFTYINIKHFQDKLK